MTFDQKQYNLDRKAASKLLKISTRTLDRHVKTKKVPAKVIGGRIWFSKADLADYRAEKDNIVIIDSVDMSTPEMSIDNEVDNVDNVRQGSVYIDDKASGKSSRKERNEDVFKKLFEELKEELKEKQERLEMANYRVGQLENQLRNTVPLLEYNREAEEKKRIEQDLGGKLIRSEDLTAKKTMELRYEKFSKRIYLIILLIILAIQPLWLLFIYK